MKLLLCLRCGDCVVPTIGRVRSCKCRKVQAQYLDAVNAEVRGPFAAFGMNTNDIVRHARNAARGIYPTPYSEEGYVQAWAMPRNPARLQTVTRFSTLSSETVPDEGVDGE